MSRRWQHNRRWQRTLRLASGHLPDFAKTVSHYCSPLVRPGGLTVRQLRDEA